jgi:hypothetical protein
MWVRIARSAVINWRDKSRGGKLRRTHLEHRREIQRLRERLYRVALISSYHERQPDLFDNISRAQVLIKVSGRAALRSAAAANSSLSFMQLVLIIQLLSCEIRRAA